MELVELSVFGFRSLANVPQIPIRKQTILTGHNDCGKTATLDALAFLLGEIEIQDSDVSQFADSSPERSALPLPDEDEPEPRSVTVEGSFCLTPAETELLQVPSTLRVRRRFVEGGGSFLEVQRKVSSREDLRDLESRGATELRELGESIGLTPSGRANAKASWVGPLNAYAKTLPEVDGWAQAGADLRATLPQLLYFKGDAAESPESVVRAILTAKLREHTLTEDTRKKIEELEDEFSERLKADASRLRELVKERCALDEFSLEPHIQFKPSVGRIGMSASGRGQRLVPLSAAGAGRSRRIALALWEGSQQLLAEAAEADGSAVPRSVVIVYDEPDTHLDYDHQRRIMQMIKASAAAPNSSVIVATHSLNLIDGVDIQDIVHLSSSKDGRAHIQSLGNADTDKQTRQFMSNMAASLGFRNSVLLHEKCFVGVEGPSEYAALPILFKLAMGFPMQSAGIALWACGGNDGALNFARFLKEHKRTVVFMVDADSTRDRAQFANSDRLQKYGFKSEDCIYIGDPNELEDVFTGEQWAKTMNDHWPRDSAEPWAAADVDALRSAGKFSAKLHAMLREQSSQAPQKKQDMVIYLAQQLESASEVPLSLREKFKQVIEVAADAGQPRYWAEDD